MKRKKRKQVLLIGEFSNLHWTLAEGLRKLDLDVIVASNGDGWKNYKRDIDISLITLKDKLKFLYLFFLTSRFRGYEVVQLINISFITGNRPYLNKICFQFLKLFNKSIFLGAYGDDYFFMDACKTSKLKYSPFLNLKEDKYAQAVYESTTRIKKLNHYIANEVDGVIAGSYSYYVAYKDHVIKEKLKYIPFPININQIKYKPNDLNGKLKVFVGVQKKRQVWKGTDKIIKELQKLKRKLNIDIEVVSNVPYEEYLKLYNDCNVLVDQLYSYSPGMNALTSMAKGKIVVSGGEKEMYKILDKNNVDNFPIININPLSSITKQLEEELSLSREEVLRKGKESRMFVEKYHNYIDVAEKYMAFWSK